MAAYKAKPVEVPLSQTEWEELWLNLINEFEKKLHKKCEIRLKDYFKQKVKNNFHECFSSIKPIIRNMKLLKHFKQYEAVQVVERIYRRKRNFFYMGFTEEITETLWDVEPTSNEDENSKWDLYKARNTREKVNIYYARLTRNSTFDEVLRRFIDNPLCLNEDLIEKTGAGIGYIIEYEAKFEPHINEDRPKRPKSMKVVDADIEEKEEEEQEEKNYNEQRTETTGQNQTEMSKPHLQPRDIQNQSKLTDQPINGQMQAFEINDEYVLQWLRKQSAQRKHNGLLLWVANDN